MNKWLLGFLLLGLSNQPIYGQESDTPDSDSRTTYFQTDFEQGIDSVFSVYDLDRQTLHFSMLQAGFKQGDAFAALREKRVARENHYAGSTSKYKYEKDEVHQPSNDWLVTPQIWIRGEQATLSWRAKSICNSKKNTSGYKVLVSTLGNRPENFKEAPIYIVQKENDEMWIDHEVSLKDYVGQRIYIAFVNDNLDKEILGLDDIEVSGEKGLCELVLNTKNYEFGKDEIPVRCAITAYTDEPIKEVTAYYTYQNKTYKKQLTGLSLKNQETMEFTFDETIPVACGDTVNYEVWAEINDSVVLDKILGRTISFLFQPRRKTVIEEGTGMWCGYCPKGTVAMELLEKKYPDEFIGIALHYDDPMEVKPYREAMNFPSFPSGWINRQYLTEDPMVLVNENGEERYTAMEGGFETYFLKSQSQQTLADLSLTVSPEGNLLKVGTQTRFAIDRSNADYQIAFVVVEDSVQEDKYYQANYFSGQSVEMGGYESLPGKILSPVFNHVARGIYDDYQGFSGSVPSEIVAGEVYGFESVLSLPATVKDLSKVKVVALLIDKRNGEIVNANVEAACVTGIENVVQPTIDFSYRKEGNQLLVDIVSDVSSPAWIRIYTLDGVLMSERVIPVTNGKVTEQIAMGDITSNLMVLVSQNGQTKALKILF